MKNTNNYIKSNLVHQIIHHTSDIHFRGFRLGIWDFSISKVLATTVQNTLWASQELRQQKQPG